jgi:hypothetical protein
MALIYQPIVRGKAAFPERLGMGAERLGIAVESEVSQLDILSAAWI